VEGDFIVTRLSAKSRTANENCAFQSVSLPAMRIGGLLQSIL
jgi:hypothetical protein